MKSEATSGEVDVARLIQEHQAGVWRYLRALGCDPAQAEDFTQETFLKVLQSPFEQRSPAETAAFLRTVARNLLISAKRKGGTFQLVPDIDQVETVWRRWVQQDQGEGLLEALRECLTHLTERARRGLEMRFRDRCSRSEIAAELEMSEDGAKNLLQRAKQRLRACIQTKIQ